MLERGGRISSTHPEVSKAVKDWPGGVKRNGVSATLLAGVFSISMTRQVPKQVSAMTPPFVSRAVVFTVS